MKLLKQSIAVVFIIIMVVSLTLAVMKKISWIYFYLAAIISAVVAFWVLPKMK